MGIFRKSRINVHKIVIAALCVLLTGAPAWAGNQRPLSQIPVPEPPDLSDFVADRDAAIRLGKALFWDMQAGSDGMTACASCHYRAGADPVNIRNKNQLHPGPDTLFGNNNTVIKTFTIDPVTLAEVPLDLAASGRPQFGPNYTLNPGFLQDFPLFQVISPLARLAIDPVTGFTADQVELLRDTNDAVGSQGVRLAQFAGIDNGSAVELSTPLTDSLFTLNGANIRQVTGRNSPPAINAVFTFTNFWDGRANNIFNGVNPLGPLDVNAMIWVNNNGTLERQRIAIPNASLASQAVGPPLSDVEMSFRGRTFPELGRKMLNSGLTPLGTQLVHPSDGVLGPLSRATLSDGVVTGNPGINADYRAMIEAAFHAYLWNSGDAVTLPATIGGTATTDDFTQMEANFSLFWGLAIQLYEATLVSDRTPFDRFQAGNQNAISASAQLGLATFDNRCAICHSGSELTNAAVGSDIPLCIPPACNSPVFIDNNNHTLIKKEVNPDIFEIKLADAGFFNIGVRPTADNIGRGAAEPDFPFPLSFTKLARLALQGVLPFATPVLPLGTDNLQDIVDGSFKTPGLRNVELTPPYFHNGDSLTLDQVVEFYTRGGNFPGNAELAVAMQPIGNLRGNATRRLEVVEFLKTLTDERVRNEQAPFDHPELRIPNGVDENGDDIIITLAATGGAPATVPPATLTLNPVASPTILKNQLIGGTVDSTATVSITVNNGAPFFATVPCPIDPLTLACSATVPPTSAWNANVAGMAIGHNSIAVTATSDTNGTLTLPPADILVTPTATIGGLPLGGNTKLNSVTLTIGGAGIDTYQYTLNGSPLSAEIPVSTPIALDALADGEYVIDVVGNGQGDARQPVNQATRGIWRVKANPPVLTLNAMATPMGKKTLTIGGTVELGSTPSVKVDTTAKPGTVRTIGGVGIATWSCDITDLAAGVNNITVTALDFVFNLTTVNGAVTVIFPDGNIKGTGSADISDALKALRFAVNLDQPSQIDMLHGDVAPLVNGVPDPDGAIDVADALTILRKVVGLISY
jgi:cytochrome c peroxidase